MPVTKTILRSAFLSFLLLFWFAGVQSAKGQDIFTHGLKAGITFSNLYNIGDGQPQADYRIFVGGTAGYFMHWNAGRGITIGSGLNLLTKGAYGYNKRYEDYNHTIYPEANFNYTIDSKAYLVMAEIPLHVGYSTALSENATGEIYTGPYMGISTFSFERVSNYRGPNPSYRDDPVDGSWGFDSAFDYGWDVGLTYTIQKLRLEARQSFSFSILPVQSGVDHLWCLSVTAGIIF